VTTSKVSTLLRQGIDAARRGERAEARKVLLHILELDDRNKTAWLWLSGVMVDIDDQILCLENVLTIDPENATAVEGLTKLRSWRATQEAEYETERATFDEDSPSLATKSHRRLSRKQAPVSASTAAPSIPAGADRASSAGNQLMAASTRPR
jgi:hypothetical protein